MATVDIIHTLAELSESINDLVGIPGVGQLATLAKAILDVCSQVSANRQAAIFLPDSKTTNSKILLVEVTPSSSGEGAICWWSSRGKGETMTPLVVDPHSTSL
jgi:hypothetical protein